MSSPSDAEVIGRALGEPEALGLIYDRHAATVLRCRAAGWAPKSFARRHHASIRPAQLKRAVSFYEEKRSGSEPN
jgi:hypothetical protein